nr:hypothetical protein [Tanacetum cinerariifolium]
TRIKGTSGNLYAEKGVYNTITRLSKFERNAKIETPGYLLGGDQLVYDEGKLYGVATGHVSLISKKDNILLRGDVGRYWRALGRTKLYGSRPVKRGQIDQVRLFSKAFVIDEDTLHDFNQVKGRNILAYFKQNRINRIDVLGNAESIFYALDGDTAMTGVNKSLSGTIRVGFAENKIHTISLLAKPEAAFIPPHELNDENTRLKGYRWRPTERPTRRTVFGKHFASDIKAKPKAKLKAKPKGKAQKTKPKTAPRKRPAAARKKP